MSSKTFFNLIENILFPLKLLLHLSALLGDES